MNILIVTATRGTLQEAYETPLLKSLGCDKNACWLPSTLPGITPICLTKENEAVHLYVRTENKLGLSTVYNNILDNLTDFYGCVIFVHDDVAINHFRFSQAINILFDQGNSVVGLAGTSSAKIQAPALWHLMGSRDTLSGAVAHQFGNQIGMTSFGPMPQRCLMLDGLFLAVKISDAKKTGLRFDEQFKFHHYDLDFCLTANKLELKMSTAPIWVTHLSPGLSSLEDLSFQESQRLFLSKWTK